MDTTFWNLFWNTGMPEAWLMSRDGEGARRTGFRAEQSGWQRLSDSPLAGFQPHSDNSPGGPCGLY